MKKSLMTSSARRESLVEAVCISRVGTCAFSQVYLVLPKSLSSAGKPLRVSKKSKKKAYASIKTPVILFYSRDSTSETPLSSSLSGYGRVIVSMLRAMRTQMMMIMMIMMRMTQMICWLKLNKIMHQLSNQVTPTTCCKN